MRTAKKLQSYEGARLLACRTTPRRQLACHAASSRPPATRPSHTAGASPANSLKQLLHAAVACVATVTVAAASWAGPAETSSPADHTAELEYDRVIERRKTIKSSMPSSEQSKAMLELYREAYTDDAYDGMLRLQEYAAYIEELESEGLETAPGCEQCEANRIILEKAWQAVANEFYDPSGHFTQAQWAASLLDAIQGAGGTLHNKRELYKTVHDMVAGLGDPYTEFMGPSQFRRALRRPLPAERNYLAAQYVGVGVQLGDVIAEGGRVVDAPLAGSPAEAAGIVRGDRILDIDGISADKVTLEQALALLRGPEGSTIALTVAQSSGPPSRLELERRRLPQPALKFAELQGPAGSYVGYLRMFYFSSETTAQLVQALHRGEVNGLAGYIIDLRNNPGGTFEEAIAMAADLLPDGRIVTETVRNEEVVDNAFQVGSLSWEVFGPPNRAPLTSQPVVVLVNSSSASASEVLAGALKDNGRALLVGEQTFGKGVLQYYFPMPDGSGLKLTVAKYLTPGGYDISRNGGLRPDLVCHDFPHGVLDGTDGGPDKCVQIALDIIDPAVRTLKH